MRSGYMEGEFAIAAPEEFDVAYHAELAAMSNAEFLDAIDRELALPPEPRSEMELWAIAEFRNWAQVFDDYA